MPSECALGSWDSIRVNVHSQTEIGAALARFRSAFAGVAVTSAMLNVLALTSSIYLMLVYDRVLPGRSLATLTSVFAMVSVVYVFYAAFDVMRARLLSDIGVSLDRALAPRVQQIEAQMALKRPSLLDSASPLRDLDQIRGFLGTPGPSALIDLPWIFFFLIILTLIHFWLGLVTLLGAIFLIGLTWTTERVTSARVGALNKASNARRIVADSNRRHAELIQTLGMRRRAASRWQESNIAFMDAQTDLTEKTALLGSIARIFRVFLQSGVLSVGAILVIEGKASGGIIFASSILSGRALAPVDQAIASWRNFVAARQSWARLGKLLRDVPPPAQQTTQLPLPVKSLRVDRLTLAPPEVSRVVVAEASFAVQAGDAVAILGPSASGKSSLLRGIIGAWMPVRGEIRLDGARLDQWDSDDIGSTIGYLPQSVELFSGTVAQNIARFEPGAASAAVIAAAKAAGVHDIILQLPDGYETQVGENGLHVSAGQRQRIGLARALYRDPFLVVLDEPNSNLDPAGEEALAAAIIGVRQRGGIVLAAAHRTAILKAMNLVLLMAGGQIQAFGPRDEVLAKLQGKAVPAEPAARVADGSESPATAEAPVPAAAEEPLS